MKKKEKRQLDKEIEKAVWQAYKQKTSSDLKRFTKRISREHNVSKTAVTEFLEDKIAKAKKWGRRIKFGVAAVGLVGLLTAGYFTFRDRLSGGSSRPDSVLAYDYSSYRKGPGNIIYYGKEEDRLDDDNLVGLVKSEIVKDKAFAGTKNVNINSMKGQNFIELEEDKTPPPRFQDIWSEIKREYAYLGLHQDYDLKVLQSLDQLASETCPPTPIWLVKEIGANIRARLRVTHYDGKQETGTLKCVEVNNGKNLSSCRLEDGVARAVSGPIFAMITPKDKVDNHMALYAEPLHDQLVPYRAKLLNALLEVEREGDKIHYTNYRDANKATVVTDEAIIHGLSHDWLKENLERLGFTQKDFQKQINVKEKPFVYKGAKIIRNLAAKMGRRELLADYMANPAKYWNLLKDKVPEYRNILKK